MKRTDQVQGWLSSVQATENEVAELQKLKDEETQKLCLGGCCSNNCKSSYKFGKRVHKMLQVVTTLKTEGDFKNVAEKIPEAPVDEIPIDPTIIGLQSTFDNVWTCLGDQQVGIIGLYGMGGVGKTTLLTQINNMFLPTPNDFDVVIWVVVSKDQKLEMIQETIGKKIGMGKEVYPLLKFSYDSLASDTLRSCLLYCSLFPEDYKIEKRDLIDFWIGERFFDEYETGYSIIGDLLRACLLEEEEAEVLLGEGCYYGLKTHDVIRDMALWIAYEIEKEKGKFWFKQVLD
ncbi:hypothetical protein Dsin_013420 [Dipteronia sinensis]|uniref:NB-ARC domain-containing protein n=1 Tax=Dipteronia sinensis TaxID=43782 RepID=A0AAE0AKS3_9ROSI|nr:hypothetical protein Dsin_013420 [Dipteronia sinensis]